MNRDGNILMRIRHRLTSLQPALQRIAMYILENPDRVKRQRIGEVAAACGVSESAVTRFVKAIGLKGFHELKIETAELTFNDPDAKKAEGRFVYDDVGKNDSIGNIIDKVTFKNIETLNATKILVSAVDVEKAVVAIERADIIVIYCSGTSVIAGYNAKSRFYRVGKRCILYSDATEQSLSAPLLDRKCVAIGITSSGRTRTVVNAIRMAREAGATTICITDSPVSPVIAHSDICFVTSSVYSNFMQDTMTSRMPHILIIDILYACFAVRHYQKSLMSIEKSMAAHEIIFYPNSRRSKS
jgi:RpiR family carbohydrate utilization transcriptional regulator